MNFIYIWHVGRYRFKVLLREILVQGHDLEVKVTDLEFTYKSKTFWINAYRAILSDPLIDFINIWYDTDLKFF